MWARKGIDLPSPHAKLEIQQGTQQRKAKMETLTSTYVTRLIANNHIPLQDKVDVLNMLLSDNDGQKRRGAKYLVKMVTYDVNLALAAEMVLNQEAR